jgi:translation elongation factor EF-4
MFGFNRPKGDPNAPLKALLFDSWYGDIFSGVICLVKIVDGKLELGDKLISAASKKAYDVLEVGIMHPEMRPIAALYTGQVGYLKLGMKTTSEARVGDTFYREDEPVEPLPGFKPAKPMVFAGIFPDDVGDFAKLREAVEKLCLTDASVTLERDNKYVVTSNKQFRSQSEQGFVYLPHVQFLQ